MSLNSREKIVVAGGLVALLVMGFYFLLLEPLAEKRDRLASLSYRLEEDLAEMRNMAAEYRSLAQGRSGLAEKIKARGRDFAAFSYLENLAEETGLTGQIESMTPTQIPSENGGPSLTRIDVRLGGIGLPELVRFLYRLESSDKVIFVESLTIRPRYLTPRLLDVTLRLVSPGAE